MEKKKHLSIICGALALCMANVHCMEQPKTGKKSLSTASAPASTTTYTGDTIKRYPSIEAVLSTDEKAKKFTEDFAKIKKYAQSFPDDTVKRTQSAQAFRTINVNIPTYYVLIQKTQSNK